jgi:HlyD family secretion protein
VTNLKRKLAFALTVIIIVAAGFCNFKRRAEETGVRASGTVEVTEVTVSPLVGGRIIFLELDEGDTIREGELVARLSLDGLDSEEAAKTAALERERGRLKELETGNRPEDILQGEADLRAKEIQLEQAERDAGRYAELLKGNIVSRSDAERFEENARVLRESVEASRQRYILLKKGPREEQIEQERQAIKQIEAELEAVRLQISYKEVYSPITGVILSKNFQNGEVVSPGAPLITAGAVNAPWVKVYIPATLLSRVSIGQSADIYIDSPPKNAIPGRVKSVAQEAEFNPRLSLTQEERANQVFWVKVAVSDDSGRVKPGMPADVVFADF